MLEHSNVVTRPISSDHAYHIFPGQFLTPFVQEVFDHFIIYQGARLLGHKVLYYFVLFIVFQ